MDGKAQKQKKVSIVILNYNGKHIMGKCLESCFELNFPKNKLEVIVVDNNSSDGSCDFIRKNFPKARILKNNKNIGTAGFNSAIEKAKGDFLFFLNNDDVLTPNCISHFFDVMNLSSDIGICGPKGLNFNDKSKAIVAGSWASRSFYCGLIKKMKKTENIVEVPYVGAVFIRKDVLKELGYLFDPDFFLYGEDLDLGLRVRLIGKKIIYVPQALMYHHESLTSKKEFSSSYVTFLRERNLLTTFFKVTGTLRLFLYFPYVFGMRILVALKDFIFIKPTHSFARLKATFWVIVNIGSVMEKRKETQKIRKTKDSFVFKIFTEKKLFGF